MSDPAITACAKCGWADHGRYRPNECDPARGDTAKSLIAALPEADATMLGYGFGQLVIGRPATSRTARARVM